MMKVIPTVEFKSGELTKETLIRAIKDCQESEIESIGLAYVKKDGTIVTDFVSDDNIIALESLREALRLLYYKVQDLKSLPNVIANSKE